MSDIQETCCLSRLLAESVFFFVFFFLSVSLFLSLCVSLSLFLSLSLCFVDFSVSIVDVTFVYIRGPIIQFIIIYKKFERCASSS